MSEIKSKSFSLRTEDGHWLGQIVLTSDGMFAGVTDYGNQSFAWRSYGENFMKFLCELNIDYFGSKMYQGMAYMIYGKKYEQACHRFAEYILPALKAELRKEIENGTSF